MEGYISIKQILDDILDHPLLKDISFERAINHTIHFIRIVGMPRAFNEKTDIINIQDYRGLMPCDYDSIIQVRMADNAHNHKVFRYSTDSFHMSGDKHDSYDLTYKLQGNVIYTSIKEGNIEVSYYAIPVDNEGYPMIPDNSMFIRALELYIKKQCFCVLFELGKLNGAIYNNVCKEYAWAVGQAQSSLVRLSLDQMQAFTNTINTLVPRVNEHSRGFINHGAMEKLKLK